MLPVALPGLDYQARAMLDDKGMCSGVDDCRRVVRKEVRRGADVIKLRISGAGMNLSPDGMFESREELASIIDTAHSLGRTVAIHSHLPHASALVLQLGADLVATRSNPLEDIAQMPNVIFVMKAGENDTEILR